jgi:uncharacterized protein YlxW (UPF0749 family)
MTFLITSYYSKTMSFDRTSSRKKLWSSTELDEKPNYQHLLEANELLKKRLTTSTDKYKVLHGKYLKLIKNNTDLQKRVNELEEEKEEVKEEEGEELKRKKRNINYSNSDLEEYYREDEKFINSLFRGKITIN